MPRYNYEQVESRGEIVITNSDSRFLVRPAFGISDAGVANVSEDKLVTAIIKAITLSPVCECSVVEVPSASITSVAPAENSQHRSVKQVIVVRHDLHMRQGKACAQSAHAAMMFLVNAMALESDLTEEQGEWFSCGMPKIVVRVESAEELNSVVERARDALLTVFEVMDAGHTEFHGIPTPTCVAIGPNNSNAIDKVTGLLRLL
jgi:PTH2 family peptidyl-tRNA hydrolase